MPGRKGLSGDKHLNHRSISKHLIQQKMEDLPQSEASVNGPALWVVLARAYGSMAAYVEICIAAEGLCLSDFMVLEVLLHKGPMTISAIGEKVLLANASMTAAVDRLEERGFAVRQSSDNDRRVKIVALTKQGHAFIADLYEHHARDIETVTSALSPTEQDKLRSLLKKLGLSARSASWRRGQDPMATAASSESVRRKGRRR